MATWFECSFKYNREDEQGGYKSVTETFLIDAVSFTDAEARVYAEVASNLRDFQLLKVSKFKVHDIIFAEFVNWYKVKVRLLTIDEKSGKEKLVTQTILVNAQTASKAIESVEDLFSTALSHFTITDVNLSPIVEVLPFIEVKEEGEFITVEVGFKLPEGSNNGIEKIKEEYEVGYGHRIPEDNHIKND